MNPEIKILLTRIARRFEEAGGMLSARVQAEHEFHQAFAIDEVNARVTTPTPEQEPLLVKMLTHLDAWLQRLRDGERRPAGLRLFGKAGYGKTAMAFLLAKQAAALAGLMPSLVNCADMRRHLRGSFEKRERDRHDFIAAADPKRWPLLVLDDVGTEAGNPEACELVRDIIDERTKNPCYTILTCNKDAQGFEQHLSDERTISRSRLFTDVAFIGLPDYRSQA